MQNTSEGWTTVIRPHTGWFDINLSQLWQYRDLIVMFVKRNFAQLYKQTILGPFWILLNPLITTLIFTAVFGGLAGLAPGGVPAFLFYMAGNMLWTFFSTCIVGTANTFVNNAALFGKVHFPRLTVPISQIITAFINFAVQAVMFLAFYLWYVIQGADIHFTWAALLLPLLLLQTALLALGVGIIVSAVTTKYRDLAIAVSFGVQLWMYASPVVYSLSTMPQQYHTLLLCNPVTPILETFRFALLGSGQINWWALALSLGVTILLLTGGVVLFSRVEKTFMDTV